MQALIPRLVPPITLLNVLGWLVAFVWLAIIGEWKEIVGGIAASIAMPFLFPIVDLPNKGLVFLYAFLREKDFRVLALPCAFLASLWTNLLVIAWCSLIFVHYVRVSGPESYIPLLLWGYSVALAPLTYMAMFDANKAGTGFFLFNAQFLYVGLVACFVIETSIETALIFILVMALVMPSIVLIIGIATV